MHETDGPIFSSETDAQRNETKRGDERLSIPTQFEIQVSYADKTGDEPVPKQVGQLASELDTYERWVFRAISELKIEPIHMPGSDDNWYPAYTMSVLRDEKLWRQQYRELPSFLTLKGVADEVGRSRQWSRFALRDFGIGPNKKQVELGARETYPKQAVKFLRSKIREIPFDDDWLSLATLSEMTGMHQRWIRHRLEEDGRRAQMRYSHLSASPSLHFPPDSLKVVWHAMESFVHPGGSWFSDETIADAVPMPPSWTHARLSFYKMQSEVRLDDDGIPRPHFPPRVLDQILHEAETRDDDVPYTREELLLAHNVAQSIGLKLRTADSRRML